MTHERDNELFRYYNDLEAIVTSFVLLLFVMDIVLSTVFILKGHKNNLKYLRVYHFYSVGLLLMTIFLTALATGLSSERWLTINEPIRYFNYAGYFVNIVIQIYFVLLLKSEILKLGRNPDLKLSDQTPKLVCTMKYEEEKAKRGKEMENEMYKGAPIQAGHDFAVRFCDVYY